MLLRWSTTTTSQVTRKAKIFQIHKLFISFVVMSFLCLTITMLLSIKISKIWRCVPLKCHLSGRFMWKFPRFLAIAVDHSDAFYFFLKVKLNCTTYQRSIQELRGCIKNQSPRNFNLIFKILASPPLYWLRACHLHLPGNLGKFTWKNAKLHFLLMIIQRVLLISVASTQFTLHVQLNAFFSFNNFSFVLLFLF